MMVPTEYWVQTVKEGVFNFADPKASTPISTTMIAHSLARIPRFNGHAVKEWYVAEHCLLVKQIGLKLLTSRDEKLYAAPYLLLHDAHEAFIGDMPAPFKRYLRDFHQVDMKKYEAMIDVRIREAFGLPKPTAWCENLISEADIYALKIERLAFMPSKHDWPIDEVQLPDEVKDVYIPHLKGGSQSIARSFNTELVASMENFRNVG